MTRNTVKWLLFLGINTAMLASVLLLDELPADQRRIIFFTGATFSLFAFLFCEFSRKFYLSEMLLVIAALNLEMLVIFLGYQRLAIGDFVPLWLVSICILPAATFIIIDRRRPKAERILHLKFAPPVPAPIQPSPQEKRRTILMASIFYSVLLTIACLNLAVHFMLRRFSFDEGIAGLMGLLGLWGLISNWRAYAKLRNK